jgi:methyl-accepting chemotaxis protein
MKFTLKNKLIGLFLLIGLVPFLIIGLYSFQRASATMEKEVFSHLAATRNTKKIQLTKLFNDIIRDISTFAKSKDVQGFVNELVKYHNNIKVEEEEPFPVKTDDYRKLLTPEHTDFLEYYIKGYGYHDLFIIYRPHGQVMYSVKNGKDLGTNLGFGPYKESPLAEVWRKVVKTRSVAVEDFRKYAPNNDEPGCFLGVPIIKHDGEFVGVLALQLHIETINKIMQERTGLGKTGEAYLVGKDFLMRSDSILNPKNRSVIASFSNPDTGKTETESVRRALAGETGEALTIDYRGQSVLSAYTPVEFFQIRWALMAEVDEAEAFQTRFQLRNALWIVGVVIMVVVILIGFLFSRSLSLPLKEGAQNLNATSAEILAAIQQQSSSIKEQAAAVQETSSTMEEIRETGSQVAERAKEVARVAEATSSASEVGIKAVEDTHEVMESIRAQVEQVAQNIVTLSEKTQAIGDIIATVNDIAEQSNLLALNAAIEAVGAGKHGERFSVVANEMKSLADQAKASTIEVRSILSEIQGGINTSVMSTEEAVKRVETGRSKSEVAARTIKELTDTTTESITAFQQIVAGTSQQQIGMDQVTQALKDIEQGTEQTASGIGQIEIAVANLNELSSKLKTIVESD